jgi:hypothetical protein
MENRAWGNWAFFHKNYYICEKKPRQECLVIVFFFIGQNKIFAVFSIQPALELEVSSLFNKVKKLNLNKCTWSQFKLLRLVEVFVCVHLFLIFSLLVNNRIVKYCRTHVLSFFRQHLLCDWFSNSKARQCRWLHCKYCTVYLLSFLSSFSPFFYSPFLFLFFFILMLIF